MSKELYLQLIRPEFSRRPYETCTLSEDMAIVKETINGWWKPRYLLDCRAKEAYEFLDRFQHFVQFGPDDVDWSTVIGVPKDALERARSGNAIFPIHIYCFKEGRAEVSWQINPDGLYYSDDDGFGMTDDEEITLYGEIDRSGRIVKKFEMKV